MTSKADNNADAGKIVFNYVNRTVNNIYGGYSDKNPMSVRQLAQLRRAAGKIPGLNPEIWDLEFGGLPEDLLGSDWNPKPSRAEWAVHIALTLYAVHQQSQPQPMHAAGKEHDFGVAVKRLVCAQHDGEDLQQGQMPRRFAAMVTAQSVEELAHYARQIVGQLRSNSIPIDYSRFARQVFWFQTEQTRTRVCREWACGYSQRLTPEVPEDKQNE